MSELSDGLGADGKGVTQTGRGDNTTGKKRRGKSWRKSRPSGQLEATASAEVGERAQEQFVQREAAPEIGSVDRENTHRRARRRSTRPGNKRALRDQESQKVQEPQTAHNNTSPQHSATSQKNQPRKNHHRDGERQRKTSSVYAALDLGTNNCRLLVAVPRQPGKFRVIDGFSKIVRLGEGLSQTGRLSDEAMDRAIQALKQCAAKLENREIRGSRLIATEACRQAENGQEFLDRVLKETGLELEVVSRETEARLAAEGCGSLMDRDSDAAVMFDIGGGSTELILVNGRKIQRGRIRDRIGAWTSLPMGVVTLAERFGGQEVSFELFDEMKSVVLAEIERFDEGVNFQAHLENPDVHLLGTSGTVTTLAGIHLGLQRYERRRVDGLWMSSAEIDAVTTRLLEMNYEQRRKNPCIGSERADMVLAGCAILEAIRATWPADRLRVADRGLREGLLTEMMDSDKVWRRGWSRRRNARRRKGTS